jgi:hypothetical protein
MTMFDTRPTIVCLCGSTRFSQAFQEANLRETLAGNIILTIGCDMRSDADIFGDMNEAELTAIKAKLDTLHLHKIDIADEVLILNVGGYIGRSTYRELLYAHKHGKRIRYLEPQSCPDCDGTGMGYGTIDGIPAYTDTCSLCSGSGKVGTQETELID